jgi:phosphatidylglycerophosphatase A
VIATSAAARPPNRSAGARLLTLLATGFGSGYSPIAPGTAGTAVGLALFLPLRGRSLDVQVAATIALFLLGVVASSLVAANVGRKDPGIVVVDEIVGVWVTLLYHPLTLTTALLGFLLFRLLDMRKPWPARQFEALPKGWGIMADDVMAGVYANLCLRVVDRVMPLA